jgi:hypothetical protein
MVAIADAPLLAAGCVFVIDGVPYTLCDAPERDTSRLSWSADLEIA